MNLLRKLFCQHEWSQRYWGGSESGYLCVKCGRIEYRKGSGGPLPRGIQSSPVDAPEVPRG